MIVDNDPVKEFSSMESLPSGPPAIRKEILRDKIFEVLKGWILDGTLKPGERIVELTLARKLSVSRAPLREALWLLARHGLVHLRAHRGAFVTRLSAQDIREIFELREVLETQAALKIRARLRPPVVERLKSALSALEEAAGKRDIPGFSQADLEFHRTLWSLGGNRHAEEILGDLSTRFFGYELIRDLPHAAAFRFDAVLEEHRKMIRLILEGTDREIQAGFRKAFGVFLEYVLSRFGEGEPERAAQKA
jgi:DNA-binding GntR family transcriptional regulator